MPWEAFVVGSLFGWKRESDNARRFRVAFIEAGKGCGKSPIAAGIGMKGLLADYESLEAKLAALEDENKRLNVYIKSIKPLIVEG